MVTIKIQDRENGAISNEVPIEKVIFEQRDIEFKFPDGGTLPYDDFLFYQSEYEVIVKVGKKAKKDR